MKLKGGELWSGGDEEGGFQKRVEHKVVREIRPSLNVLGMRKKRSGGRQEAGSGRLRGRGGSCSSSVVALMLKWNRRR